MSKRVGFFTLILVLLVGLAPGFAFAQEANAGEALKAGSFGETQGALEGNNGVASQSTSKLTANSEEIAAEDCALLRSDGSLWTCSENGVPVSSVFPSSSAEDRVRTLFVASDVKSIPNVVSITYTSGSTTHTTGSHGFYLRLENLETVHFLTNNDGVNLCTALSDKAFRGCSTLKEVANFDKTCITRIGNEAFENCSSMQTISIPATVTNIGKSAFEDCSDLGTVHFLTNSDGINPCSTLNESAFRECARLKEVINFDKTRITSIENYAFFECKSLESIGIPATVSSIGNYAFEDCFELKSVSFSSDSNLKAIGYSAFSGCTTLSSISFPKTLGSVKYGAFTGCTALKLVNIPSEQLVEINSGAFENTPLDSTFDNGAKIFVPGKLFQQYEKLAQFDNWGSHLCFIPGTETYQLLYTPQLVYTGKPLEPGVIVRRCDGVDLNKGTDYQVLYENANGESIEASSLVNVGSYKVHIRQEGEIKTTATYTIIPAEIDYPIANHGLVYSGKNLVGVSKGTGYTVKGGSATNAGIYTAMVTPDSNHTWWNGSTDTREIRWYIYKGANPMKVSGKTVKVKHPKKKKKMTVKASKAFKFSKKAVGQVRYTRVANESSKWLPAVDWKTGKITVKAGARKGKTYKVKVVVQALGNTNYQSASKIVTVKVKVV